MHGQYQIIGQIDNILLDCTAHTCCSRLRCLKLGTLPVHGLSLTTMLRGIVQHNLPQGNVDVRQSTFKRPTSRPTHITRTTSTTPLLMADSAQVLTFTIPAIQPGQGGLLSIPDANQYISIARITCCHILQPNTEQSDCGLTSFKEPPSVAFAQ